MHYSCPKCQSTRSQILKSSINAGADSLLVIDACNSVHIIVINIITNHLLIVDIVIALEAHSHIYFRALQPPLN